MPYGVGHKKIEGSGRKKGTPNKVTQNLMELADKLEVNPIEVLLLFAKGDHESLGYEKTHVVGFDKMGQPITEDTIPPKLRCDAAKEACGYLFPKRKAIEHTGKDGNPIQYQSLEDFLRGKNEPTPSAITDGH